MTTKSFASLKGGSDNHVRYSARFGHESRVDYRGTVIDQYRRCTYHSVHDVSYYDLLASQTGSTILCKLPLSTSYGMREMSDFFTSLRPSSVSSPFIFPFMIDPGAIVYSAHGIKYDVSLNEIP